MGFRRIAALGAAGVLASFGLSGLTASPASADVAEVGGGAAGLVATSAWTTPRSSQFCQATTTLIGLNVRRLRAPSQASQAG